METQIKYKFFSAAFRKYDNTFSLWSADPICPDFGGLHQDGERYEYEPIFDESKRNKQETIRAVHEIAKQWINKQDLSLLDILSFNYKTIVEDYGKLTYSPHIFLYYSAPNFLSKNPTNSKVNRNSENQSLIDYKILAPELLAGGKNPDARLISWLNQQDKTKISILDTYYIEVPESLRKDTNRVKTSVGVWYKIHGYCGLENLK